MFFAIDRLTQSRTIWLALLGWLSVFSLSCNADIISFDTSSWDHGGGPNVGWVDGQFSGQTTFGGAVLNVSSSEAGSAIRTTDHFRRIDESFFSGFAFQLDPDTTVNTTSFDNYARYDFEFSVPIILDSFTLTDVDRLGGQWYDVVAAEGFTTSTAGAIGSGLAADYSFAPTTNIETFNEFGLLGARPVASSGNVLNTPENDVTFSFSQAVQSFSIYHWNDNATDDGAATQTIGIRGNQFEFTVVAVPEPGSFAALATLGGLVAIRRRRSS